MEHLIYNYPPVYTARLLGDLYEQVHFITKVDDAIIAIDVLTQFYSIFTNYASKWSYYSWEKIVKTWIMEKIDLWGECFFSSFFGSPIQYVKM